MPNRGCIKCNRCKGGHLNATEKFYMHLFGRSKKKKQSDQ